MKAPRILVLSDLHLEFADYTPAKEGFDLVVLAGDIHTRERGVAWAARHFECPVLYVRGNHEGYGTHWERNLEKMRKAAEGTPVVVMEKNALVLDSVRYLGATGWTTFDAWPDPRLAMHAAGQGRDPYSPGQRDYRLIRTGAFRRILPRDTAAWSAQTRHWLQQSLAELFDGPMVVITHHAPSPQSLEAGVVSDILDAADVNTWDDWVAASGVSLWIHGHTHHCVVDYTLGRTRIVSNTRGYPGQQLGHRLDGVWSPRWSHSLGARL